MRTCLLIVMALLVPTGAQAASSETVGGVVFTYTDDTLSPPAHLVRRGLAAAQAHFGRMPDCPGGIAWKRMGVEILPPPEGPAVLFAEPARSRMAAADCTIWVTMRMLRWNARQRVCAGIAHEVGHLLGYGHSERGLMAPSPRVTPACRD